MRYNQIATESHPLALRYPKHLQNINAIIVREGGMIQPFTNEVAINLDEAKRNSDNTDVKEMCSMDMLLEISNQNDTVLSLLVEFKLDCKNAQNISEKEYRKKIRHSKILLFGSGIPIHHKYVFIFNDNLLNLSRRIISQRLTNAFAEVLSIDEFKTNYF